MPSDLEPVPCLGCSKLYLQHYAARGCEAVFDDAVSRCCPASFKCSPEVLRADQSSCSYKGKTYAIGEDVPIQDPCQAGCFCREGVDGIPTVECAQVECPSLFNPPQPGCRNLYNIEQCCEVDKQCGDLLTPVAPEQEVAATTPAQETGAETEGGPRTSTCLSEGKEYQLGDKIYFDEEPCQYCVCTDNFTDAFGANCTSIDCGMDYRYAQELQDGCTPVYFRGGCCSIEWICPNSDRVKPLPKPPQPSEESSPAQCRLGDIIAPRGESLPTDNCNLNCVCSTPPDFTCVQYTSCDEAAAALKADQSAAAPDVQTEEST
ncbi:VWFC domain [Trinorchestia longiramus]|nr:VWFC domain [Trinorchestia longiramus]